MNTLCVDGVWVVLCSAPMRTRAVGTVTQAMAQPGDSLESEWGHPQPMVPKMVLLNHLLSLVFRMSGTYTSWRALGTTSG